MSKKSEKVDRWRKKYPEKRRLQVERYLAKHGEERKFKARIKARAKALIITQEELDARKRDVLARRTKNGAAIAEFKSGGCITCGEKDQRCLDLHHRNPTEKKYIVARLMSASDKTLLKELEKCDVLCANCHRKLHNGNRDSRSLVVNINNPGRPKIPDALSPNA